MPPTAAPPSPSAGADTPLMAENIYELLHAIPDTYWRYVTRHKLFHKLWRDHRTPKDSYRMLDVGCGSGGLMAFLKRHEPVRTAGIDLFFDTLRYCHQRGLHAVAAADATRLPFPDNAFDFVLSQDVLEHVPNDAGMLSEIHRVTAPGGLALILVPAFQWLWSTRDVRLQHCRRYNMRQLTSRIREAGFTPVKRTYSDAFLVPPLWLAVKMAKKTPDGLADIAVDAPGGTGFVNSVLTGISRIESAVARRVSLPFGVSAIVLARKA